MSERNSFFTSSDLNLFLNQYGGGTQGWNLSGDLYDVIDQDHGVGECEDGLFNIVGHQSGGSVTGIHEDCLPTMRNQSTMLDSQSAKSSQINNSKVSNINTRHNSSKSVSFFNHDFTQGNMLNPNYPTGPYVNEMFVNNSIFLNNGNVEGRGINHNIHNNNIHNQMHSSMHNGSGNDFGTHMHQNGSMMAMHDGENLASFNQFNQVNSVGKKMDTMNQNTMYNRNMAQNMNQNIGQSMNQNMNQNMSQTMNQNMYQNARNMYLGGRDMNNNMVYMDHSFPQGAQFLSSFNNNYDSYPSTIIECEDEMEDIFSMAHQNSSVKIESDEECAFDPFHKGKRKRSLSFNENTPSIMRPFQTTRTLEETMYSGIRLKEEDEEELIPSNNHHLGGMVKSSVDMISLPTWPPVIYHGEMPNDEAGSVKLSSKMDKYNLFMIGGLLYIRRDKCLAFEVKLPFQLPDSLPEIEYRLRVRQRDASHYTNVYKESFIEYEFNGVGVNTEVATIPESHIDRERRILRIPFKLTKGQKALVEGYKNIFKLQFNIKWAGNIGCSIWFSFRYDSRGNEKKSNYKSVTHICGKDQVFISPMTKDAYLETSLVTLDTPIIYMEPTLV